MAIKLFAGRVKDKDGNKLPPVEVPSDASPGVVKEPPQPPPKRKAGKSK